MEDFDSLIMKNGAPCVTWKKLPKNNEKGSDTNFLPQQTIFFKQIFISEIYVMKCLHQQEI
ncbi:MAG: hypothetical protein DRN11_00485 [Thermoplasmata archaeon]|nr:MAG: hypothetical protein DRN11_00485 [Thermoplasmata archaeon]